MGSAFKDIAKYKDIDLYFMKRAQILIADLYSAFHSNDLFKYQNIFNGIDTLTCFADYRLPQLLNTLNVLEYNSELQQIIDDKVIIEKNTVFEFEIRASTILVIESLKDIISKK